jgi:hypothetical protein
MLSWVGLLPFRCERCDARFLAFGERLRSRARSG